MMSPAWVLQLLAFVRERWGKKQFPERNANNAGGATPGPEALHNPYRRFYTKTRRLEELRPTTQMRAHEKANEDSGEHPDKESGATSGKPGQPQQ